MKLFIWNYVSCATESYHDEGGVVVIAEHLERARAIIRATAPSKCEALTKSPDLVRECEGPEYIAVHPDAGCC